MFHNGSEKHFSQKVDNKELAEKCNLHEIKVRTMQYALDNKVKKFVIYHDYGGNSKLVLWLLENK